MRTCFLGRGRYELVQNAVLEPSCPLQVTVTKAFWALNSVTSNVNPKLYWDPGIKRRL